jgi:hypothetical protein
MKIKYNMNWVYDTETLRFYSEIRNQGILAFYLNGSGKIEHAYDYLLMDRIYFVGSIT